MKRILSLVLALLWSMPLLAAPPTEDSIQKLLVVSGAQEHLKNLHAELEKHMKATTLQALQQYQVSEAQQQEMLSFLDGMLQDVEAEIGWQKMSSLMAQAYAESLTQEEVDSMIASYEASTDEMFVAQVTQVMRRSMALIHQHIRPVMEQVHQRVLRRLQELQQ